MWVMERAFCRDVLGIKAVEQMRGIMQVAQAAGWWWPFADVCVITERPNRQEFDERGRFHSATGPALSFRDGWKFYQWHGVRVPAKIILHPERLSAGEIGRMRNMAARRCAIERFGVERFLRDSNAERIHADQYGELYKAICSVEQVAILRVVNSTAEKDGSFKSYFLHVPPSMTTAHEAVAWTFGLDTEGMERYEPIQQT